MRDLLGRLVFEQQRKHALLRRRQPEQAGRQRLRSTAALGVDQPDHGAGPGTAAKDPDHTLQLRSSYSLDEQRELEVGLRKVAALDNPAVPGYWALDARFGWRLRPGLELSVVGRNLNGSHGEYGPRATRAELGREVGVKLVWQN